jgi:beta-phosphoglucomutase-like phosphatase (HAD superfamily)
MAPTMSSSSIDTVVFDLDGVILDTEQEWNDVRRDFASKYGGHWNEFDQPAVMGANSMQWAEYMRDHVGVDLSPREIYHGVIDALRVRYAGHLPLIPGAPEAVVRLAPLFRLGVASSSPIELIEYALELAGLRRYFSALVSSDQVATGKPAPDVYLEACARLFTVPVRAAAVEDSSNGLIAASSAGLAVIAVPNRDFPPSDDALALADIVLRSVGDVTGDIVLSIRGEAADG